jgi:hypothetical protein
MILLEKLLAFGDEIYAKSILELSGNNDMDNYCILIFDNCENVQTADEICKQASITKIIYRTHRCNIETCESFKTKTCNGINEKLNYGIFPMWR